MATKVRQGQIKNEVRCRAYMGSTYSNFVANTMTKIPLDTENYDSNGDFDSTTNYRFTAPVSGYYQVSASILFTNLAADNRHSLSIYKNGSRDSGADMNNGGHTQFVSVNHSDIIYLAKDDYIELYGRVVTGSTTDATAGNNYTFMAVHLLSEA